MEYSDQLVLISGESTTGKSRSLKNIRNQPKWFYLSTEAGKRLPFKNNFDRYIITDPLQVEDGFDAAIEDPSIEGIIVDSATFLMDMFESQYVLGTANTMQGWSDYAQFWKKLAQEKVPSFGRPVIFTAHTRSELNESLGEMVTQVPIKGALKNNGIESYFSTVVSTKKMPLKKLVGYENDLLNITDLEEELGFKYVFQTQLTKATTGERIRTPDEMFSRNETFIDNDAQVLLDRLNEYYK